MWLYSIIFFFSNYYQCLCISITIVPGVRVSVVLRRLNVVELVSYPLSGLSSVNYLPLENFLSIQHNQPCPKGHSFLPLAFQHQQVWVYSGQMPAREKHNYIGLLFIRHGYLLSNIKCNYLSSNENSSCRHPNIKIDQFSSIQCR